MVIFLLVGKCLLRVYVVIVDVGKGLLFDFGMCFLEIWLLWGWVCFVALMFGWGFVR